MAASSEALSVLRFVWSHPANKERRFRALARATYFQLCARLLRRRTQTRVGDDGVIWVELHRTSATKALYANPPDWLEMLVWKARLRPGDLFLDVGANVGVYTAYAATLGAEVIAVEPAPDSASLLRENIALNSFANVTVVEAAAGTHAGLTRFSRGLDTVNRLDPTGPVEVQMVTVDSLIGDRKLSGMKVDVEGFEFGVLQGASSALRDHRIALIKLEWNSASLAATGSSRRPIADLLESFGYCLLRPSASGKLRPAPDLLDPSEMFAAPVETVEACSIV